MAYTDVALSAPPSGQAVVLFHGKNFPDYYSNDGTGGTARRKAGVGRRAKRPD
jgi:hypothetical protein